MTRLLVWKEMLGVCVDGCDCVSELIMPEYASLPSTYIVVQ